METKITTEADMKYGNLVRELASLLNKHSEEKRSGTPDFMLAEFMLGCLTVYENTISAREKWYGRPDPFTNK